MKVLFISSWYPHRYDAMAGLFVRKHAQAVSARCEVRVIHVHADENIKDFEIDENKIGDVTETIVYYPVKGEHATPKTIKFYRYFKAYYLAYSKITKEGFIPDIVHANVLTRTVLVAFLIKKLKGIPYLFTEHWSRYLQGRKAYYSTLHRWLTLKVAGEAEAILPVSELLKEGMITNGILHTNFKIVNNVVENIFYNESDKNQQEIDENRSGEFVKKKFIHVSCFDEKAKNIFGILRAVKELSLIRTDFEFILIGTGIDFEITLEFAKSLNFPEGTVFFTGELPPIEVAAWFREADAFVLFSNYETAGVVIAESLVSGVPVIASRVGIATEFINDTNGILVNSGDEKALKLAMLSILNELTIYNRNEIMSRARAHFSYEKIGSEIVEVYKDILKRKEEK